MALAVRSATKFGELENVTKYTRLYDSVDMQNMIDAINAELVPASRDEATTIVALLLSCYPHSRGKINDVEWAQVQLRLFETFSKFPAIIGFAAVDVAGLPSRHEFLPRVFHIDQWCQAYQQRLCNARAMGMRHIAEKKRRVDEQAERERRPEKTIEERRAFVARVMAARMTNTAPHGQ